jgi:hypothetical protein
MQPRGACTTRHTAPGRRELATLPACACEQVYDVAKAGGYNESCNMPFYAGQMGLRRVLTSD